MAGAQARRVETTLGTVKAVGLGGALRPSRNLRVMVASSGWRGKARYESRCQVFGALGLQNYETLGAGLFLAGGGDRHGTQKEGGQGV